MELVEKAYLGSPGGRRCQQRSKRTMLMRKTMLSCNLLHPWHALAEVKQVARTTRERAVAHTNIPVPGIFTPPSVFSIC